jgi:hypothetical protein
MSVLKYHFCICFVVVIVVILFQVTKILLRTSGRVLSGAVTIVFGGATMIYDIYRLNEEVQTLAGKGKDGATDIR